MSVEERATAWIEILDGRGALPSITLVAEERGRIVGFASTLAARDEEATGETGELAVLYVLPSHWDRGIGRRLIQGAVDQLVQGRFTTATLWVLEENARGRHFYEAAGWAPDGATQLSDIGGFEVPEVRYRRAL